MASVQCLISWGGKFGDVQSYVVPNEDAEESKADEYNETDQQPTTTHREVILQT